jgi:hypothetical protein
MNLAIGTLIILLIVLPGIAFSKTFYFGPLTKKTSAISAFDDFIKGIIPGVVIQIIFACVVKFFFLLGFSINIDFKSLGLILFGDKTGAEAALAFGNIQTYLGTIFIYNVVIILIAAWIGWKSRKYIRKNKLDLKYIELRFNNEWYYFLKGEFVLFKENETKHFIDFNKFEREVSSCIGYAMVKSVNGSCHIYYGIIHDFTLNGDGELDTLTLRKAERIPFNDNKAQENKYSISADLVFLKASEILNLSVHAVVKSKEISEDDQDKIKKKTEKEKEESLAYV